MFKKASKGVCTSTRPLLSYSITYFSYEEPENTEQDPDDHEPVNEDIHMEYSCD
jgi:hypothetical protein